LRAEQDRQAQRGGDPAAPGHLPQAHPLTGAGVVMDDDALEVIREAERTVYHAQWRIWEELALEHLACTRGLARAPLVPGSDGIQLVTWQTS
ncbi:MAG TPA: hypothetical protein VMK84_15270, partial [Streptosporangiaceae bacterium]|nr:hypothetical protein [Streptosporangiaceae bacterium]